LLGFDHALAIDAVDHVGVVQRHAGDGGRGEDGELDAALGEFLGGGGLAVVGVLVRGFVFLRFGVVGYYFKSPFLGLNRRI
jgi:hypothetical protein